MTDFDGFQSACNKAFASLRERFHLEMKVRCYECVLKNATTAIRITYEPRNIYVFVQICRLIDGELILPPGDMKSDSVLHCYDVDYLHMVRKPFHTSDSLAVRNQRTPNPIDDIWAYATYLEECGNDLLSGNFEVFQTLEPIVKERAREYAILKWGNQVHEHGW